MALDAITDLDLDRDTRRLPTTTLTGWRAFVDDPEPELELMPEEAWSRLSDADREADSEARLTYHSELVTVDTSQLSRVSAQGRLLIMLNRRESSARRAMVVSGAPGTGKSTNLKQLGRIHEMRVRARHPGRERIPVVYVTAPPQGHSRMFAVEFARFLELPPVKRSQTTTDIADQVCQLLIAAHCDLVLVDEVHNLDNGTRPGAEMTDNLKYFIEHLPATFVYAGINVENSGLFTGVRGEQLAGRSILVSTSVFPYGAEWRALVSSMEAALRLYRHMDGTLARHARYLHQQTGGKIASLSQLVRSAAQLAIVEGGEAIDKPLLQRICLDVLATRGQ